LRRNASMRLLTHQLKNERFHKHNALWKDVSYKNYDHGDNISDNSSTSLLCTSISNTSESFIFETGSKHIKMSFDDENEETWGYFVDVVDEEDFRY